MTLSVGMDDALKKEFIDVCGEIGLNASAAVNVFAKACVREQGIPFALVAKSKHEQAMRQKEHHITESVWQGYNDYVAGNHVSLEEYDAEEAEWEASCNRRVG